eukprot:8285327-Pyramimonas_sp.AAC.1
MGGSRFRQRRSGGLLEDPTAASRQWESYLLGELAAGRFMACFLGEMAEGRFMACFLSCFWGRFLARSLTCFLGELAEGRFRTCFWGSTAFLAPAGGEGFGG